MNIQQLKTDVKEAFANVDSAEFLRVQIEKGVEKHRRNFLDYIALHPKSTFMEWKQKNEEINVNTTDNNDIMAQGIFLLALDEFNHENL